MNITINQQNPMINFRKIALNKQNPKFKEVRKYPLNAWKHENKTKKRDKMVLPALREKKLAKIEEENDKKFECSLANLERERKSWKTFEKDVWNSQRTVFKKPETRCSIDRKIGSINRTKQRLIEFLKQNFDWSKIRLDQSKFKKNSFLEK